MEQKKRIFVSLGILVVLVGIFFVVTSSISKYSGLSVSEFETKFQLCLKNQDINLYINTSNSDQAIKDTGLIDDMAYFKIKNCHSNNQLCADKNINSFPTWIINGKTYAGDINVNQIVEYTGCSQ